MSVFHKTMVWLGLVDDEEYYGDDENYVDEYGDPAAPSTRQPARATATVTAPAPPESTPLTVIRSRRERDDPSPPGAPARPRPAPAKPTPMPAPRVHALEPKGFNDP